MKLLHFILRDKDVTLCGRKLSSLEEPGWNDPPCHPCDRKVREAGRAFNGLPPFTDEEYAQLRRKLDGRIRRTVLVVKPDANGRL